MIDENKILRQAAWRALKYLRDLSSDNSGEIIDDLCNALGVSRTGRRFEKDQTLQRGQSDEE